mmetsp:Transcript_79079/g.207596  ORF Transcript_79079/g.207596 Transcript_79079/m.207596 type:complete len:210 (+) Transcript_79079:404-1033(+)
MVARQVSVVPLHDASSVPERPDVRQPPLHLRARAAPAPRHRPGSGLLHGGPAGLGGRGGRVDGRSHRGPLPAQVGGLADAVLVCLNWRHLPHDFLHLCPPGAEVLAAYCFPDDRCVLRCLESGHRHRHPATRPRTPRDHAGYSGVWLVDWHGGRTIRRRSDERLLRRHRLRRGLCPSAVAADRLRAWPFGACLLVHDGLRVLPPRREGG